MTTKANIYIDQGTDWSEPITIVAANSSPIDITGGTVFGSMKAWYTSANSYSIYFQTVNATAGQVTAKLSAAQTEQIPAGRYVYNINFKTSSGNIVGIVEGISTINPSTTYSFVPPFIGTLGKLDFSNPDNSGLLACLGILGSLESQSNQIYNASLNFNNYDNSGLLACLGILGSSVSNTNSVSHGKMNFSMRQNNALLTCIT